MWDFESLNSPPQCWQEPPAPEESGHKTLLPAPPSLSLLLSSKHIQLCSRCHCWYTASEVTPTCVLVVCFTVKRPRGRNGRKCSAFSSVARKLFSIDVCENINQYTLITQTEVVKKKYIYRWFWSTGILSFWEYTRLLLLFYSCHYYTLMTGQSMLSTQCYYNELKITKNSKN